MKEASAFVWTGRVDSAQPERLHQYIQSFDHAKKSSSSSPSLSLVGFACDAGVTRNKGRAGAAQGPRALREHLANLCLPEQFSASLYDAGDIHCTGDELEAAQQQLARRIQEITARGSLPLVLGGGHETAWGTFQGIFPSLGSKRLGILNFDAHFDLRPLQSDSAKPGTSGTPFNQIALFCEQQQYPFDYTCIGIQSISNSASLWKRAEQLKTEIASAEDVHLNGLTNAHTLLGNMLDRCDAVYVSICLDVFAAAYAPGVSAPTALGLNPWQVIPLLRKVLDSGKVVAIDVVELAPALDEGSKTAKLAAALVMDCITLTLGRSSEGQII
jgi:formiminoglutamase